MRYEFKFPDIGEGIAEGTIVEWYVEVGQQVKSGDNIVKMETDKVVADIPSPRTGVIVARHGEPKQVINVGNVLVEIEVAPKAGSSATTATKPKEKSDESVGVVGTLEIAGDSDCLPSSNERATSSSKTTATTGKKALATPSVRALARKLGININQVPGTGRGGRVTKQDLQKFSGSTDTASVVQTPTAINVPEGANVEYESLSQIRKTIAKRMVQSKNTAPHMTVFEEVEVSQLVDVRNQYKQNFSERGVSLTYLPFVIKAVVQALKEYRVLNAQLDLANNRIIYNNDYNVGIAVDAPDGLMVPVIRHADRQSIFDLSKTIADLAQRVRDRQIALNELQGGTFTITNYGTTAGLHAVPIINYPEVGILGVGRIRKVPVVKNDSLQIGYILPLSLSVDHRIVDGGETTRFLKTIVDLLSDPMSLLMF